MEMNVCAAVEASEPGMSRQSANQINMSERTVQNIWKTNGYYCYKVHIIGMKSCETSMDRQNENVCSLKNIVFTDEWSLSSSSKHNSSIAQNWSW